MSIALALLVFACGDPSTDTDADPQDGTPPTPTAPPDLPGYSGGDCPDLSEGVHTIDSQGLDREVSIWLPSQPKRAPVVFAWHYLGGNPEDFVTWFQIDDWAADHDVVVIAPRSRSLPGVEWDTYSGPGTADLQLFDDLLTCAWEQWEVDLQRVYSTGFSAGALWTANLTQRKSRWLAAAAPLSGGAVDNQWSPRDAIPMLVTWGGPTDVYGVFSFEEASYDLLDQLDQGGHFAVQCVHDAGHSIPPVGVDYVWDFFAAHPKDVSPDPWQDGLPNTMPAMCLLP